MRYWQFRLIWNYHERIQNMWRQLFRCKKTISVTTFTHIPVIAMAAAEEVALGKSSACRWCAGASAAGAGVWKNPGGTMAARSFDEISAACHSPSPTLVLTPLTSLTTGHLHYRPGGNQLSLTTLILYSYDTWIRKNPHFTDKQRQGQQI
jgi:hypothetical protein